MTSSTETPWLPIGSGYTEEFGPIDIDVYEAAGSVWPLAERFARTTIRDSYAGRRLMLKAVAAVSRVYGREGTTISNLSAYVFQAFKRLVLAEIEKENGHRRADNELASAALDLSWNQAEKIERSILVQQIVSRMDPWTREVFEMFVLGHSFEEIGRSQNRTAHAIGKRFRDKLREIRLQIARENEVAKRSVRGARLK